MGASKELRERNLEQSLAIKKEVPSDTQDVWQIVENLRKKLKRLEDEMKPRFTVLSQVNGPRLPICQCAEIGSLDPV